MPDDWESLYRESMAGVAIAPTPEDRQPFYRREVVEKYGDDPRYSRFVLSDAKKIGGRLGRAGELPKWDQVYVRMRSTDPLEIKYHAEKYKAALSQRADFKTISPAERKAVLSEIDRSVLAATSAIDSLVEETQTKPLASTAEWEKYKPIGPAEKFGGALATGTMELAATGLKSAKRLTTRAMMALTEAGLRVAGYSGKQRREMLGTMKDYLSKPEYVDTWAQDLQETIANHPRWGAETTAKGLNRLSQPGDLVADMIQSGPFMATCVALTATGRTSPAIIFTYMIESQQAYEEAISAGASEEQATLTGDIVGTINAAIEFLQAKEVIRFARGGREALIRLARERTLKAMSQGIGAQQAQLIARESLEEVLQGTTSEVAPWIIYGEPVKKGFIERRMNEALVAAGVSTVLGGAGMAIAKAGGADTTVAKEAAPKAQLAEAPAVTEAEAPAEVAPEIEKPAEPAVAPEAEKPAPAEAVPEKPPGKPVAEVKPTVSESELPAGEVERYISEMGDTARAVIPQKIAQGQDAKEVGLWFGRELGKGLGDMGLSDAEVSKVMGGLYTQTYVVGSFGTKSGVVLDAKEYFAAVREGIEAGRQFRRATGRPESVPAKPKKPMSKGLAARRQLVSRAKELGVSAKGKSAEIEARIAEAEAQPPAQPAEAPKQPGEMRADDALAKLAAPPTAKGEGFSKGDIITDGLIRAQVLSEGIVGKDIPAYRVKILSGRQAGQESAIVKDQARLAEPPKPARPTPAAEGAKEPSGWEKKVNKAKQNLKDKLGGATLRMGIDPTILKDVAVVVADYVRQGLVKMADVVRRFVSEYGKNNAPYARKAFRELQREARRLQDVDSARQRLLQPLATEQRRVYLQASIRQIARERSISNKTLKEIVKEHGGVANLLSRRLGVPELEAIRTAARRARPETIKGTKVVTPKTEAKIKELRRVLGENGQMTDADFNRIVADLNLPATEYVPGERVLSEPDARLLLKRMNLEAELIGQREETQQALSESPEIGEVHRKIEARLEKRRAKRGDKSARARVLGDARYSTMAMEEDTGGPFYKAFAAMMKRRDAVNARIEAEWTEMAESSPEFAKIARNADATQRVNDYIESQLPDGPKAPENITPEEVKVAKVVMGVLKRYESKVKLARFYDYYYIGTPVPEHMGEIYEKAVDIYENGGLPALQKFLEGSEWGVIRAGYSPWVVLKPTVGTRRLGPAMYGSKRHIRSREPGYRQQDDSLWVRLAGYMRRMGNLTEVRPGAELLGSIYDANFEKFSPNKAKVAARILNGQIAEAMGASYSETWLEDTIARLYSQVATATFLKPRLAFRNLFQNMAFNEDFQNPANLKHFADKLTAEDRAYFEEHVSQARGMERDFLMQSEKPLVPWLTQLARKLPIYRWSDTINRWICYKIRLGMAKEAVKNHPENAEGILRASGANGLEALQQIEALEILAREGADAFARYVAAEHTANVHFKYDRAQRSHIAHGRVGRIFANLLTFPRSWGQRIWLTGKKAATGRTWSEKVRGARVLVQMTVGSYLVGRLYMWVTGDDDNPYEPGNIAGISPGGLVVASVQEPMSTLDDFWSAMFGDGDALNRLIAAGPRLGALFIPFYDAAINFAESLTDKRVLDRYALRRLREWLSENYKTKRQVYEANRTLIERIQHAVFGKQNEAKKTPKGRPGRSTSRGGRGKP